MKCVIVEDEPLSIGILEGFLSKYGDIEVVGKFTLPLEAFEFLNNHQIDLMFLDIKMPQISGIELLKSLSTPPKTIITTAFREYAYDGFELNVIDYLLKPFSFTRFLKAMGKVDQKANFHIALNEEQLSNQEEACLYVRENRKTVKILLKDILYFESLKDYVRIHTLDKPIITYQRMSFFENRLSSSEFIRIHRSYIVSIANTHTFDSSYVKIADQMLPISRNYRISATKALRRLD